MEIGDNLPLVFIGGPCAIESLNHAVDMAGRISDMQFTKYKLDYKFATIKIADHLPIASMA